MKNLLFSLCLPIILATSCTESAFKLDDADKYPSLHTFPNEFQGVYVKGNDSLIVKVNDFRTVSTNPDVPPGGILNTMYFNLKKHGNYYVMYNLFGTDGYYHLRFFSQVNKQLIVKKVNDNEFIDDFKRIAKSFKEEDADGMGTPRYYFTIDGKILDIIMDKYLTEEYRLDKVK